MASLPQFHAQNLHCCICYTDESVVDLGCVDQTMHLACMECAEKLFQKRLPCPICRQDIHAVLQSAFPSAGMPTGISIGMRTRSQSIPQRRNRQRAPSRRRRRSVLRISQYANAQEALEAAQDMITEYFR